MNTVVLNRVELYPIESLPKLCSSIENGHSWSSQICFAFLFDFLHFVQQHLGPLPEGTVLVGERLPHSYEFKFVLIGNDDNTTSQKNDEYCVISDEFKVNFGEPFE